MASIVNSSQEIDLLSGLLDKGEVVHLRAAGLCMRPWISPKDTLTVSPLVGPPLVGMIVLVRKGGDLYAHRIVAVGEDGRVKTRGDSLDLVGIWSQREELLGEVTSTRKRWGFPLPLHVGLLRWAGLVTASLRHCRWTASVWRPTAAWRCRRQSPGP